VPDLSIIIGVYNEAANIRPLLDKIETAFDGVNWEVIYVDDASPDGTADEVRTIAQTDHRVRLVRRMGERGLASACVKGWLVSTAPYMATMDGDLQHEPRQLRLLYDRILKGDLDLVNSSRFLDRSQDSGMRAHRAVFSAVGNRLAGLVARCPLTDPMSGLFVMTREFFQGAAPNLSPAGFKILLDLVASSPTRPRFVEYHAPLGTRLVGESKLDSLVLAELVGLIVDKATGGLISPRLALFLMVGFSGMGVHAVVLGTLYQGLGIAFLKAQAVAIVLAMTSNYFLNNLLTFRDVRRTGMGLVTGLAIFYLACSVGAVISVQAAGVLFQTVHAHWLVAGLGGAVLASLWNYVASSLLAWRLGRKPMVLR
jgi:dolichol-phosphate mannosyltransferase